MFLFQAYQFGRDQKWFYNSIPSPWISIQSFSLFSSFTTWDQISRCECIRNEPRILETSRTFTRDLAISNLTLCSRVLRGCWYFCFVWRPKTSFWCLRFGIFSRFRYYLFLSCVFVLVRLKMIFGIISKTNGNLVSLCRPGQGTLFSLLFDKALELKLCKDGKAALVSCLNVARYVFVCLIWG